MYASCLKTMIDNGVVSISSAKIAKALNLGEVQVRKELAYVSGGGKPRIGYDAKKLLADIQGFLGKDRPSEAVIVGAGRLGCALLGYGEFEEIGVRIGAAFDVSEQIDRVGEKKVYPLEGFLPYCKAHPVEIGIITVPAQVAQSICDLMLEAGVKAIWNFAPTTLQIPDHVSVVNEKLAISLSQLRQQINL